MHTQLATRLYVAPSSYQVSQAISTEGGDNVRVDFTIFDGIADEVTIQESNDLENWKDASALIGAPFTKGYHMPEIVPVSAAFVRVKWEASTSGDHIILGAGINLSNQ